MGAFRCFVLGWIVYGSSIACGSVIQATLRVCFFRTGQGNCIALRMDDNLNGPKLIFIDCGGGAPIKDYRKALSDQDEGPGAIKENI
ncbi:MAG: hypothetical protein LBD60_01830 [Puniceicoccales bacterium]|nr:hypothetical protein [Puniceicoccales bacterium]